MAFTFRDLFSITVVLTFVFILLLKIVNFYPTSDKAHLTVNVGKSRTDIDAVLPVNLSDVLSYTTGSETCHTKVHRGRNYSIIYNVMPKTGSRTFTSLIRKVSSKHSGKQPVVLTPGNSILQSNATVLRNFYKKSFHKAILVRGHNVFVPQWSSNILSLNTIREPIPWMNSRYYYSRYGDSNAIRNNRKDNSSFSDCVVRNLSDCQTKPRSYLRFFCGDSPLCGTDEALRISKANLDSYLIVGLTEEYESFILLVEKFLPDLYRGLVELYREKVEKFKRNTKTNQKEEPSEEAIKILKERTEVQMMYEFYNFVKTKFHLLKKCL